MAISNARLLKMLQDSQARVNELEAKLAGGATVYVPVVEEKERVVERVIYIDNPELVETINTLRSKLCQYTSQ